MKAVRYSRYFRNRVTYTESKMSAELAASKAAELLGSEGSIEDGYEIQKAQAWSLLSIAISLADE